MENASHGLKSIAIALAIAVSSLSACIQQRTILNEIRQSAPSSECNIWFVKSQGTRMSMVGVKRRAGSGKSGVESAVRALLEGPSAAELESGLGSEIPRGTILLGVSEEDGSIVLDLSRRFASGGGSDSMETRLEQLAKTVSAVAGNQPVFLNVEGQRLTMTQGEGIEIKQPINRGADLAGQACYH